MPYRETIVDRLRHPEPYDLLVPDCAVGYGVDGFRAFLGAAPMEIEWDGEAAYGVDPATGDRTGTVDFSGGGGVVVLPEEKRALTHDDLDAVEVASADEVMAGPGVRPFRKAVDKYGDRYFVIGVPRPFTVESMYHVQGMEQTLTDVLDRPDFVKAWTERQLEVSIQCGVALAKLGADALYVGETFGQFMSPPWFAEHCLPYFQRFVEALRPHGPLIYLHMCGRVTHLLDLMVETGVDCIEPLDEVGGTLVAEARARVGDKVALMGGVNTVLLSRGSVAEVRADSARCIREAGRDGGYILAAGDMLPTETAPEKVRAMVDAACAEGRYG